MHTSKIIDYISFNDNRLNGSFYFAINGNVESTYGNGYTKMIPAGNNNNLGRGKIIAHMNTTFGEYDLVFTLESYADFVVTKIKNFEPKWLASK